MKEIPSSDEGTSGSSSGENNTGTLGITDASIQLGEGSVLYLQSMKTFDIMFTVLFIINLPVYIMYEGMTSSNDVSNLS